MVTTPDFQSFPGDVEITACTITSSNGYIFDVTPQMIGIEVYEDIFTSFITGKILLKDAIDLPNLFPLVGEESLNLSFITPGSNSTDAHSGIYYIFKMDDHSKTSEREQLYVLHFMSVEGIADINKKISKTYAGKVHELVQRLVTDADGLESPKKLNLEESPAATKYTSNFWSPAQNITYLMGQAQNANKSPSYVFFENRVGFHFVSLDTLYGSSPVFQSFRWDNYSADFTKASSTERNLGRDYQRVMEFSIPENFNYMDGLTSGRYGSQMITYDLTTKQYSHVGYVPEFAKEKHLNQYPLNSSYLLKKTRALLINEHRYYNNFNNFGDATNTKFLQRRLSLISAAEASRLQITVAGRSTYTVGQKVYVEMPANNQITQQDGPTATLDKIMTGFYLVAALCHKIDREKHECVMELIKESFILDLNNVKREQQ